MRDGPHIYRHQILGKMMIIMDNPEWDIGVPHFRQTMTNPNHRIRCTCYLNNYKTKETLSMRSVQSGIHLDCLDFFTSKILTELQADVDRPPHIWRFSNHGFLYRHSHQSILFSDSDTIIASWWGSPIRRQVLDSPAAPPEGGPQLGGLNFRWRIHSKGNFHETWRIHSNYSWISSNYTSIYASIFTVGIDELMFKISALLSSRV